MSASRGLSRVFGFRRARAALVALDLIDGTQNRRRDVGRRFMLPCPNHAAPGVLECGVGPRTAWRVPRERWLPARAVPGRQLPVLGAAGPEAPVHTTKTELREAIHSSDSCRSRSRNTTSSAGNLMSCAEACVGTWSPSLGERIAESTHSADDVGHLSAAASSQAIRQRLSCCGGLCVSEPSAVRIRSKWLLPLFICP
jgi:hypothetical protein